MFHRSERLFLRPVWPEDWSALLPAIADEAVVKNLARVPWPYGAADARGFTSLPQHRRYPNLLITLPESGEVIGGIGLSPGPDGAELGYWLARAHWGRGFAGEAARAMLLLARQLGHSGLVAHHFLDNPASGRVLARLGFRPTGASERFSLARGHKAPAVSLRLRLGDALEDDPDDGVAPRKAA